MSESPESEHPDVPGGRGAFPATRWSLVARLKADSDSGEARAALEDLCKIYWFPLYAYARKFGKSAADAEDLTQAYFAKLLQKDLFAEAKQEKGKLRSFLLTTFKRFLKDAAQHANALKRGGGNPMVPIEGGEAERRYALEPADDDSPDKVYERRWALAVLDQVLESLRREYEEAGKGEVFEALKDFLAWNAADARQADVAHALGMSENAVRVAVFRLRRRYGDLLRRHIADTVASPDEVADELDHLMRVLS